VGFRDYVWGLGFRVYGLVLRIPNFEFWIQDLG
jgi:hypothetical protein